QPHRLQRGAGNPDRREEMPGPAADDHRAGHPPGLAAEPDGLDEQEGRADRERPPVATSLLRHSRTLVPNSRVAGRNGRVYAGRAGHGRLVKDGRRVTEDFYVQVRYSGGRRWVAVAVSEDRRLAASLAAAAYQNLADDRGRTPTGVRIMGARELEIEGGP